jgi:multimeric flavodoxin WrbA
MNVVVFHGSPRKGNTYFATKIFLSEMQNCGEVDFIEFFMPKALPAFCTGCMLCQSGLREKCPNAQYVTPILDAIIGADALVFATPHYGACSMPGSMKTLFDHLDFLVLNVSPRAEIFSKKAFIITTGAGSAAAIKPIKSTLTHWGANRVYSLSIRMLAGKWDMMPEAKQKRIENKLRRNAQRFFKAKKGYPYLLSIFFYHMSKFVVKKYIGKGNFPYEYWEEKGYFKKRPF